jgi:AraC-like DNA-binding protein
VKFAFPQWKGFELAPEGQLLDQIVDLAGPMGMAYERSAGFAKAFHTHDRPMIVLPRGSCRVRVRTGRPRAAYHVDHASLLIVPRGVEHDDEALTAIFDTVALYPSAALLEQVINDEGFPAARVRALFGRCQKLARSRWLGQLLQEYIFARVVSRRESARTLAFLERQILVELIASALGRRRPAEAGPAAATAENVVGRALRHIEGNLFAKLSIAAIAREAFASPSTLLRQFRREMGRTPLRYITRRRLEEARRLLEADNHPVGEVAALVGYENFGAFSTAFRKHFGKSPSAVQRGSRGRPTQGERHGSRHQHP